MTIRTPEQRDYLENLSEFDPLYEWAIRAGYIDHHYSSLYLTRKGRAALDTPPTREELELRTWRNNRHHWNPRNGPSFTVPLLRNIPAMPQPITDDSWTEIRFDTITFTFERLWYFNDGDQYEWWNVMVDGRIIAMEWHS